MRARLPWIAVVVALLAACSRPEPAPEPVRAVRTLVVQAQSASATQQFAAEVRARVETPLAFQVGGKLVERRAHVGDAVRAGQVLARLDPQDLRLGVEAAQAAAAAARVQWVQADADAKRFRALHAQGFISGAELERHESTLLAAQAHLAQAQAQAGVQGNLARYSELRAATAGVVTAVEAEPGAVLAAGAPVLRLAHDGPRDVVFSVPEGQFDRLRALAARPDALSVRVWGDDASAYPARIREVAAAADPVTRTFQVKADVGAAPLRLGQTATVVAALPRRDAVIRLPLTALHEQQGRSAVWVFDPTSSTVAARVVEIGGAEGNDALVASGLEPGERVVSAGVHVLTPGQKVTLYAAPVEAAASR